MEFVEKVAGQFTESLDEKLNKLKRKLDHLVSREDDIKVELEYAEQLSLKKRRKEVENWLKEVGRTKTEVQDLEARVKEKSIPKYLALRNSIDRCTTEVNQLIQRGVFHGGLTLEAGESGVPMVTTELVGKNFQKNKTAIWEKLMNDNISSVGVYGMGGIGKTILITHIHDQLLKDRSSSVAWVTVSQDCSTFKLQDDIIKVLGLGPLYEKDERKRAAVLASALRKKENFVLILDDIWDYIKLDEVGIPANEIGCKLIITTRFLDVCRKMDCQEQIKVEPLSEKDAWELFQMHLGHNATLTSQIEEIAKSLVNEFAGLPLGIILAAGCLRGADDICQWNDALEQMKDPSLGQDDELDFGKVFQVLKYSFDKLNPTLQQCFLYCALYPEDYKIDKEELIQHFIDEKLIHEMNTWRDEFNRGHAILNKLADSCLLERGDRFGRKYVKMHDVVRDMAIKIASMNSPRCLVGVEDTDKLEDEKLKDIVRMSFRLRKFDPDCPPFLSPRCPILSTMLFFGSGYQFGCLLDCFFTHLNRLTVLYLSYCGIDKLPTSVYNLQCLTSLVLKHCICLRYMPSLENLKSLRRLDLYGSGITELPQGIDTLTNLRYLDLRCRIKVIPDGIFCKLSRLQYLCLDPKVPARGEEIGSLRKLETLCTCFLDLNDFNACVNLWKDGGPTDYLLVQGYDPWVTENWSGESLDRRNNVHLMGDCASARSDRESSLVVPNNIKSLKIENLDNVDVATSFCDRAFDLRDLSITSCGRIKKLLPCSGFSNPAFRSLKFLYLEDLQNLSDLVEVERSASSSLHAATFCCLTKFQIYRCHGIKRLFTPALVYNLQNLQILEVEECDQMVEIIEPSDELDAQEASSSISSALPKLSVLKLYLLPELKFFCSSTKMDFPPLKSTFIHECPKLKRFPPLPPLSPSEEAADSTSIVSLEGIEIDEKEGVKYAEECPKLKRSLPLPPLPPSKEAAGSTSTISLEEIEIDENERAKWSSL